MIFDRYVIVDWSASNRPRVGKDSVWVCVLGTDGQASTENPPTRGKAEIIVRDAVRHFVANGERVLVGFDFPYGTRRGSPRRWAWLAHRGWPHGGTWPLGCRMTARRTRAIASRWLPGSMPA
jgi:hypothetical protein